MRPRRMPRDARAGERRAVGSLTCVLANLVVHHVLLYLLDDDYVPVQDLRNGGVQLVSLLADRALLPLPRRGPRGLVRLVLLPLPRGLAPLLLLLLLPLAKPLDAKRDVPHALLRQQPTYLDVPTKRRKLLRGELLQRQVELVLLLLVPLGQLHVRRPRPRRCRRCRRRRVTRKEAALQEGVGREALHREAEEIVEGRGYSGKAGEVHVRPEDGEEGSERKRGRCFRGQEAEHAGGVAPRRLPRHEGRRRRLERPQVARVQAPRNQE